MSEMEQFYRCFYHRHLPDLAQNSISPAENLTVRLQKLLDVSLQVGEEYFGLKHTGSTVERCRRLEEAGWNYIYRYQRMELKNLSPLKRGLADWIAAEADLRMLHMRLTESFVAVSGSYVQEKPCFE
ncbi:MAG: 1-acyl-sn-glycerol-3-phosphate acyltransferase, partial [Waterburya sp.]